MPFNSPTVVGSEFDFIRSALASRQFSGNGPYCKQAEALLSDVIGAPVLLTTSCTSALEMAAILLGVGDGDEVIVPSFSFVSCAGAFALRGATPVFVDVDRRTFNVDPRAIRAAITPRTRAIVIVHYAGVSCEMGEITEIAGEHSIPIIEDNAHGLFGRYRGRLLGSFGRFATLSFHETKNLHCGEGGALILNNPQDVPAAQIVREKGTDRSRFLRAEVDKYQWVGLGSSYVLSELLAAFLVAQLDERERIQHKRRVAWQRYDAALRPSAPTMGYTVPSIPESSESSYHIYYLVLKTRQQRDDLIDFLGSRGVEAVFHYQPLDLSPFGAATGGARDPCPISKVAGDCLVRLPLFYDLSDVQQATVIEAVQRFFRGGCR